MLLTAKIISEAERRGTAPIWYGHAVASFPFNRTRREVKIDGLVMKGLDVNDIKQNKMTVKRILRDIEKHGIKLTKKKGFKISDLKFEIHIEKHLGYGQK